MADACTWNGLRWCKFDLVRVRRAITVERHPNLPREWRRRAVRTNSDDHVRTTMPMISRDHGSRISATRALRGLLIAAMLACPVAAAQAKTIRAVMHADVRALDPILS